MRTHRTTLSNGLRVIFIDTQTFPTLTTLLLVGAGSRYENEQNNGIAHFFEHMAFKGSKKYPNSFTISSAIEGLGGVFNAFTSKDHTGYWIKATTQSFKTVADVLSDMVLSPLLVEEEIEREKGVIIEEINMYEDMPARKVGDLYEELLYKGTPLGFDIAGTKETVSSFDRTTFTDYISTLYHPNNAVLIVAGGFDVDNKTDVKEKFYEKYLKIIESKFGAWQIGNTSSYRTIKEGQNEPQMLVKYKKTEQTHFSFGFRAFSFKDTRRYTLSLLSAILGGGMSSRLFIEVRERRGLCYYISTGRELYADVGNIVTQAGVTNELDKVKDSMRVIWQEHNKVAQGQVTKEELHKAKELIKGRMLLSMEDSFTVASFYGIREMLESTTTTPEEVIKKLDIVTVEEVVELAKELFKPENLNIALIGPYEQKDFDTGFVG
jgi:predicted Zn-dependent peptidase